jgi:hypothetical protein
MEQGQAKEGSLVELRRLADEYDAVLRNMEAEMPTLPANDMSGAGMDRRLLSNSSRVLAFCVRM